MLDERSKRVLWAVIESYINHPGPVGSRYVCKRYEFGYSPATIRNIMADLEDMGYLRQPHTSAGRVPTEKGYRLYVEHLLEDAGYNPEFARRLSERLGDSSEDMEEMLEELTKVLTSLSRYMAMAVSPGPEGLTLRRIEMVPYKDNRIAVLLLTEEGVIRHHILRNEFGLTAQELQRVAGFLNREFGGYTIKEIRQTLVEEMIRDKQEFDSLVERALKLCDEAIKDYGANVFLSGIAELMELPEFSDIEKIKTLYRTIEDKHTIIKLIDKLLCSEGVQVVIGSENPIREMHNMSVVASVYRDRDRPAGVIGIIGPTRMNYQQAISLVETASEVLTTIIGKGGERWKRR